MVETGAWPLFCLEVGEVKGGCGLCLSDSSEFTLISDSRVVIIKIN